MDYSVRCGSQISSFSNIRAHFELHELNNILLDSRVTHMSSLFEVSKSLKINKEEVPRKTFTVQGGTGFFHSPVPIRVSNCRRSSPKGLHIYSAASVGCWSQDNYYIVFLPFENTDKANSGRFGFRQWLERGNCGERPWQDSVCQSSSC